MRGGRIETSLYYLNSFPLHHDFQVHLSYSGKPCLKSMNKYRKDILCYTVAMKKNKWILLNILKTYLSQSHLENLIFTYFLQYFLSTQFLLVKTEASARDCITQWVKDSIYIK